MIMGRYLIQTPVAGANTTIGDGDRAIHFRDGRVELDEVPHWLHRYCTDAGYSITDQQPHGAAGAEPGDDDNNPVTPPPGNASTDAWREHCLAIGGTDEQVAGKTRDELKELANQLTKEDEQQ